MWRYRRTKCSKVRLPRDSSLGARWANCYEVLHSRQGTKGKCHILDKQQRSPLLSHSTDPHQQSLVGSPLANILRGSWKITLESFRKLPAVTPWSTSGCISHLLHEVTSLLLTPGPPEELPALVNGTSSQPASHAGNTLETYVPWYLPLPENRSIFKSCSLTLLNMSQICPFCSIPMATNLVPTITSPSHGLQ